MAAKAEVWHEALSALEELRTEADEYRVLDHERVLVLIRFSGRGKTSGWRSGKCKRWGRTCSTLAAAR